jgi:ATP-dependent Clp protease protease subunit
MKIELDELLAYGVDLKNRRIYFGSPLDGLNDESLGDFTQASVELAVRALHKLASDAPGKPIELYVNSYGGSPYDMLRLYDEILACPCQVKFIGSGVVMSAATWIMAACDERLLHPNTTIMVHDGSDGFEGKHTDAQIQATEMRRLQELLYEIYESNSRMPKEFWQDVCQRDLYLTAHEAVTLGLADRVIEHKKRGNLRRSRQASLKKTPDSKEIKSLIHGLYARINKIKVPKIELNELKKEPSDPSVVLPENDEKNAPVDLNSQPAQQ